MGTNRSLFPFPTILTKPSSKNKSEIFKSINSLTLKPQPYMVSSIALFLSPSPLLRSTAEIKLSISSFDKVSGNLIPILGVSIKSVGLDAL